MIKDLFIRQKQFFSNLSLKKKFMSIIIALLFLMLAGFGIGMLLVRRSDDLLFANDNGQNPLMDKARAYVENWKEAYRNNTGLLLFGDVGTGKEGAFL